MNILEKIIEHKKEEIEKNKKLFPVEVLMQADFFHRPAFSLKQFLSDETKAGIIAEFKRRSPSKGIINADADVAEVNAAYNKHGASCLSVLTDSEFFGGSVDDLRKARVNPIPVLRIDFIIDEYQLVEAKAIGADVILLIAACLSPDRVKELASFAKQLQLEVLLEIHHEAELKHICDETELVGVNNRKDFSTVFLPHTMTNYTKANKKMFYFGRDTYGWTPTSQLMQAHNNDNHLSYLLKRQVNGQMNLGFLTTTKINHQVFGHWQ